MGAAQVDMVMDELVDYDATISKMCYGNYVNGGKEAWVENSMKPFLVCVYVSTHILYSFYMCIGKNK